MEKRFCWGMGMNFNYFISKERTAYTAKTLHDQAFGTLALQLLLSVTGMHLQCHAWIRNELRFE